MLNEVNFLKGFSFNIFSFSKYHFTDCTKSPLEKHYFGCLIKGKAKIKTRQIELNLVANEVFYIPKGIRYQSHWFAGNDEAVEFYSFGFDVLPSRKVYDLQKIQCDEKATVAFNELCREIPFTEKGIGKLYYFFGLVSDKMQLSEKTHYNPTIDSAIDYMSENYSAKIPEIARFCNVSESGLYLLFKKQLGKTPNDIRNKILCEKAFELLSTTNKSVQEISDLLGFSSTSYFRKILKRYFNKTPIEIRKESAF